MLSVLDYSIIGLYLAATIGIGLHIGRRIQSGTDYFLAGRSLPWWAIGLSLVATDIGGTDVVGVGGAAYTHGLAVANFEWIGCVPAMIIGAFVFAPHFWRIGIATIPEYFERRYHVSLRLMLAGCWLAFMACNLGVMLLASGRMMLVLLEFDLTGVVWAGVSLAGQELLICILAIALLTGAYTTSGGLAAVVYTDVIQCVVMIVGCLAVLAAGLVEVGGVGPLYQRVMERGREVQLAQQEETAEDPPTPVSRTALILPADAANPFPWPAIYFGLAFVLSPAYWFGNQAIIQRAFGAKSDYQAKAAYVAGALLKNIIPLIIAVPGIIAFALYPDLANGDQAFPTLAGRLLPMGMKGLFVAAFLAALMSSVDSYLNAAATIFTYDVYQRVRGSATTSATMGRAVTVVLSVWGVGFALWTATLTAGIYSIFQTLMSFFQGPALALLLFGVFWRRANTPGALCGFLAGLVTSVGLFLLNLESVRVPLGWQPLFQIPDPFLYYSVWSFLVATATLVVVSLFSAAPSQDRIEPLLYHRREATS